MLVLLLSRRGEAVAKTLSHNLLQIVSLKQQLQQQQNMNVQGNLLKA